MNESKLDTQYFKQIFTRLNCNQKFKFNLDIVDFDKLHEWQQAKLVEHFGYILNAFYRDLKFKLHLALPEIVNLHEWQ